MGTRLHIQEVPGENVSILEGHGIGHSKQKSVYRGADKSLARPGRKQATATEDFDFHVSYL